MIHKVVPDAQAALAGVASGMTLMLGATHGLGAWPNEAVAQVCAVSQIDLTPLTDQLLALRTT